MNKGFIKVASAIPKIKVADCLYNTQQIETLIAQAEGKGVEIIVFPELCITGYTCQDLFRQRFLIEKAETSILMLLDFSRKLDIISIVGVPVMFNDVLINCAAVIQRGTLLGLVPKTYLPNYHEFYEKRWFASALDITDTEIKYAGNTLRISAKPTLFRTCNNALFGIELCEDVWAPQPPSDNLCLSGANIIFNLSASNELIGKHNYLKALLSQQSARTLCGYVYSSCGFGESTQDVVYGGNAFIYENGKLLEEAQRFSLEPQLIISQIDIECLSIERSVNTTFINSQKVPEPIIIETLCVAPKEDEIIREINPWPFVPKDADMSYSCDEIFSIQVAGLAKRLVHTGCKTVILGISGGLDSTLALLVCIKTFDKLHLSRKGIIGVTMPGFGTTDRTHNNALGLMESLGITSKEICISDAVIQHFKDIDHDMSVHNVTYENSQARERTQILMDLSNKYNGLVIGTGDLSELALGWATYNGDHMSMYAVNVSIPKTLIKYLVKFIAISSVDTKSCDILLDIIDTPISPELIPADSNGDISQKTEDLVGPYELHDFYLFYTLRYGFEPSKVYALALKAFDGHDARASIYDASTIKHWLKVFYKRFFSQQFKRSCLPDGPKVGSVSLSPRGDWRMPSDASSEMWLKECELL